MICLQAMFLPVVPQRWPLEGPACAASTAGLQASPFPAADRPETLPPLLLCFA